jgi:O-antigen/teichoic acid export membrane protein
MSHFSSFLEGPRLSPLRKQALDLVSLEQGRAVADQAVVSGTWFFTTLLIAHYSDAGQLGVYAVGISLLAALVVFQDSLIFQPYTIERNWPQETPVGTFLILSLLLSAGSTLALTIGALGFLEWHSSSEMAFMTLAIAGALPLILTREVARRTAFARLGQGRAMLLEMAAALTQLSALGWLGLNGRMSAISACAALGAASAIPVAAWLYCNRTEFAVRMQRVRTISKQTWPLAKWLLVGRIAMQVQKDITYWVAILIADAAVTGVYAACMSIVNLVNPLVFALDHVLTPKLALAWKNDGGPGLWHEAVRNTLLIASLALPFTLAILAVGETVMRLLYHGTEYEGHGYTLTVLTLAMFSGALSMPASIALATLERPRAIVTTGTVGAVVTVILAWLLMKQWGLLGAACGSLAGAATVGIARWAMFRIRVPKGRDPTLVMRALKAITGFADNSPWKIIRIGEGLYAEIFLMQSNGLPIWHGHPSLVAKLYKPVKAVNLQTVQAQFNSLSNLHAALHSREINGWKVSIPCPLYIHKSPLALAMTQVPGKHIDSYASRNVVLTSRNLLDAARAFVTTMQQCWFDGRCHGDLGVHNVLFDIEAKKISFIDPGTLESCPVCNDCTRSQSPAVLDLAHTLYDVTLDVSDLVGGPTMRLHRERFVENVFHIVIENIGSPEEKRRLLNEIWRSVQQHLDDCWKPSWSPRGMWHSFVKQIVMQRISSILERVVSQAMV